MIYYLSKSYTVFTLISSLKVGSGKRKNGRIKTHTLSGFVLPETIISFRIKSQAFDKRKGNEKVAVGPGWTGNIIN